MQNDRTKNQSVSETKQPDYGPEGQRWRARVKAAPDPDNPNANVMRAEIVSVYQRLWELGWLSDAEREAADRIAKAYEAVLACGSPLSSLLGGGNSGHGYGRTPSERAMEASRLLRDVTRTVGMTKGQWTIEVCALNRWPVPPAEAQRAARSAAKLQRQLRAMVRRWRLDG